MTSRLHGHGLAVLWAIPLIALTCCLPVSAQTAGAPHENGRAPATRKIASASATPAVKTVSVNVTAAQAARAARHEFGGKVLGVMLEKSTIAPYYRVRLISSGRVHVVHVNAHK